MRRFLRTLGQIQYVMGCPDVGLTGRYRHQHQIRVAQDPTHIAIRFGGRIDENDISLVADRPDGAGYPIGSRRCELQFWIKPKHFFANVEPLAKAALRVRIQQAHAFARC